ncbi:CYTH and CHAD domain-containing protein [Kineococcus sp. SYSU DK001]|uniref:CYTH and CHAD domain-containing protein n=1 Tax=Kineococcus sp. SYSU DK001 TaxID=3383122 RepID=UPI003D7DDFD5
MSTQHGSGNGGHGTQHEEVELKYEVDDDFTLPDLDGLLPAEPEEVQHLVATYFDTADSRLGAAQTTLRRRTGGEDAGWHAKLPGAKGARREIRLPLGRPGTVPAKLRDLLRAQTRGATLTPVAELRTERSVRRVRADDGSVLAEVVDDRVRAVRLNGEGEPSAWRELEVELVGGDRDLLDSIDARLRDGGVRRAGHTSKLSRALGRAETAERLHRKSSARRVLQAHLAEQVHTIVRQDPLVRLDAEDAVHQMRVATRRLRSALKTWRALLDTGVTEPLRAELTWLAGVLGEARDAEVMRDRLLAAVDDEPGAARVGEVREVLSSTMDARYRAAHDRVLAELDGPRYQALLAALDELAAGAPWTRAARGRAVDVLPPLLGKAHRGLRKRVRTAVGTGEDEAFHDVRKKAKEVRYAAEALTPAFGKRAKEYAKAVEGVQEVLGDHQDSVVTRDLLRELATPQAGVAVFTYGRLHAQEEARGVVTRDGFDAAWRVASRPSLRAWLG